MLACLLQRRDRLGYTQVLRNLFQNKGGFGKSGFLKILIKIRVPGPKSAHFLRPPARRPWLPTVALLASRPQRPQDAHAPGAALQAGNARPWPMAGYIHPRHHCAVASLVHRLFSSRVDALESQVQFCWQEAHGERHAANHIGGAPQRRIAVQWQPQIRPAGTRWQEERQEEEGADSQEDVLDPASR